VPLQIACERRGKVDLHAVQSSQAGYPESCGEIGKRVQSTPANGLINGATAGTNSAIPPDRLVVPLNV
jgi:hypothetical protein